MTSEFGYKVCEKYGGVFSKGKKTRFKRLNRVLTRTWEGRQSCHEARENTAEYVECVCICLRVMVETMANRRLPEMEIQN